MDSSKTIDKCVEETDISEYMKLKAQEVFGTEMSSEEFSQYKLYNAGRIQRVWCKHWCEKNYLCNVYQGVDYEI